MKILVVDDHAAVCRFLARVARQEGHEVLEAADGEAGWRLVREQRPHLVLCDQMMPGMTGLDLLGRIRQEGLQTHFVLLTGQGSEELAAKALRLGAVNYLNKPVELLDVRRLLKRCESQVAERAQQSRVHDLLRRLEIVLEADNRLEMVPAIAQFLAVQCIGRLEPSVLASLRHALQEMLADAIERGNLGITPAEKVAALERGLANLHRLHDTRLAEPARAGLRVRITFRLDGDRAEWLIESCGATPEVAPAPVPLGGTGFAEARHVFDSVEPLASGHGLRALMRMPPR
ncbi:MAG: response regulator [Candidatus Sumerlaeia bacterium]|nr:response regulator [Candidatus Sumerlaeia bacterium]